MVGTEGRVEDTVEVTEVVVETTITQPTTRTTTTGVVGVNTGVELEERVTVPQRLATKLTRKRHKAALLLEPLLVVVDISPISALSTLFL